MIEIPEALSLSKEINSTIKGKMIKKVTADYTPHKFAWYHGDPQKYHEVLLGKTIDEATGYGGMVHIQINDRSLVVGDGISLKYHGLGEKRPLKHQLLVEFEDETTLSASVQMYGGIWCFDDEAALQYPYFRIAKENPSPLSEEFNPIYFDKILSSETVQKLSVKALLATDQRIPGLGNGVLQDILWNANLHPKTKVNTLREENKETLYNKIKSVLGEMAVLGGRDTEKGLLGGKGGYKTVMSKNNLGSPCPKCGGNIKKETYLGGSIYFCEGCQIL